LIIANAGNIGVPGVSLVPKIHLDDGVLDVLVFESASLDSLVTLAKAHITQEKPQGSIKHWKVKKAKIELSSAQKCLCDDEVVTGTAFTVQVVPHALRVVVG
jgi:diacylglycerol kinase family enzyme